MKLLIIGLKLTNAANGSVTIGSNTYTYTGASMLTDASTSSNFPAVTKWFDKWKTAGDSNSSIKTNSNYNYKAVAFMLDNRVWGSTSAYGVSGKSDWAIGGPTMEMLTKSYAKYNYANINALYNDITVNATGYNQIFDSNRRYLKSFGWWNNSEYYWLASPSGYNATYVLCVAYDGAYVNYDYYSNAIGFRPVVCLNSNVTLTKAANGSFTVN